MKNFNVALAGQPNVGKSTLFNALTGVRQFVANYPGVTVEKRFGKYVYKDTEFTVIDLPGTYSLSSYTKEERVSRDFILNYDIELVIQVLDASNLTRSFYLFFQLLELEIPIIGVLNMVDISKKRGIEVDIDKLQDKIDIPIIECIANKNKGIIELKNRIFDFCLKDKKFSNFKVDYGEELNKEIDQITEIIKKLNIKNYPPRWLAIKYLENDKTIIDLINSSFEGLEMSDINV
ncbi:FeoB small GTPase domain-containing protein [Oceanotoga teriensis]|uniref:FeoB small GTPase domain-containing protein n=1 Tax=Oceanotoga teriensis TaxID=515440 RepID=UPI00271298C1|nr:FeoB small GTPase domain-containing protein [Oceanotoga teriensis]MDO7976209.1 50S ribosome-binding GTPase [Oceanotoga teriensis]